MILTVAHMRGHLRERHGQRRFCCVLSAVRPLRPAAASVLIYQGLVDYPTLELGQGASSLSFLWVDRA